MFHLTVASFRRLAGLLRASSWICRQQAHRRMTSYTLSHLAAGAPKNWLDMHATTIRRPTIVLLHRGLNKYTVSQKEVGHFYFYDNLGKKWTQFHIFFHWQIHKKDLRRTLELKLPPPLKFVAALPCKISFKCSALQHISIWSYVETFNCS